MCSRLSLTYYFLCRDEMEMKEAYGEASEE